MNVYSHTKKTKKFILILILFMVFSFCCPKSVNAFDFVGNLSDFFFLAEEGIIKFINNIFCDGQHQFNILSSDPNEHVVSLTPENIIKGKFLLFDANIFKEVGEGDYYDKFDWLVGEDGAKSALRDTISGWYYSLLSFAIVGLLSVLVYVGIRMITSTISQDKAKYKIMFKDWLVAICLLMVMHYIMIGILNVTSIITESIGIDGSGGNQTSHIMSIIHNINQNPENGELGETRYKEKGKEYTIKDAFTYELLLLGIILLTFIFAWKYLKREFTIIFLILLGPISCITYPIDKISDGKAQAFNKWLTEFIYNVLVQPFHLLLYLVLVGSAVDLANYNILYGLACLAMLIPAEKFVKEMFGFKDKLGGGPLAAMATGAAGNQLLNKIRSGAGKASGGGGDNGSNTPNQIKNRSMDKELLTDGEGRGHDTPPIDGGDDTPPIDGGDDTPPIDGGDDTPPIDGGDDTQPIDGGDDTQPIDVGDDTQPIDGGDDTQTIDGGDDTQPIDGEDGTQPTDGEDGTTKTETGDSDAQSQPKRDIKAKANGFVSRLIDAHNQRSTEKWGSAKRSQRWINRGKKAGAMAIKATIKGSGAIAGAAVGAAIGLLSGKGIAAGALTGAAIAGRATNKVIDVGSDYADRMRTPEQREKKALKDFKANKKQIQNARASFMERNDGVPPTANELDKEMEDRFELSMYGLSDDQIDDCIELYQDKNANLLEKQASDKGINTEELKDQADGNNVEYRKLLEKALKDKDGGTESIQKAKNIAGSQSKYTANLAKAYSGKDFRDPKVMAAAYEKICNGLIANTGCSAEVAAQYAREYLTNAAKMKSVNNKEIALPAATNQTVDISTRVPNVSRTLMIGDTAETLTQQQLERINTITVRLQREGLSKDEIRIVAASCAGENATEVIDRYEATIQYLNNTDAQDEAKMTIEANNGGINATNKEVKAEMRERLVLKSTFNVQNEKEISALRDLEEKELKGKTQVQVAREFANEHRGQLNNEAHMQTARENLIEKLKAGGSSREKARKDAENIINLAGQYTGEINPREH